VHNPLKELEVHKNRADYNKLLKSRAHAYEKGFDTDIDSALKKLENARWSYNPKDERGQGNMSIREMLSPFGHDKDSDRKELYGNNGRIVWEPVPDPEPEPEPDPEPIPEPEPDPEPEPEPEPEPDPEPEPEPEPDPEPDPDPIPDLPF